MPDLIREKTVKARKAHGCMTCNATAIQPGEIYSRQTYAYDGRLYDWVQCMDCARLGGEIYCWAGYPDEGVGRDDYTEWARENRDSPRLVADALAYLERVGEAPNPTNGSER